MMHLGDNQIIQHMSVSRTDGVPIDPANVPLATLSKHMAEFESVVGSVGCSQQFLPGNMLVGQMQMMPTNQDQRKPLQSNKRKVSVTDLPSKKKVQVGSLSASPWLSQSSDHSKIMTHMGSMLNSPRSGNSGKKVVQIESDVIKSLSSVTKIKNNTQKEFSPKSQIGSFDTVRSKLRESLAAALSSASQEQEDSSTVDKKNQIVPVVMSKDLEDPKPMETITSLADASIPSSGKAEALPSSVSSPVSDQNHVNASGDIHSKDIVGEATNSWEFVGHDFQPDIVLHSEDSTFNDSFFIKDDLLLGNGLAWEFDLDPNAGGAQQVEPPQDLKLMCEDIDVGQKEHTVLYVESIAPKDGPTQGPKVMHESTGVGKKEDASSSAESVALKIESELFKFFGGVNKKYKEKGRSLLFNLKDRNNPELRERVMSGEIPPEKLCSMTAEELASKELSQWRIAKAEELDQMKVLPDVEIDIRRLVRKTHKGEFQVEFEHDIAASVDVSVKSSLLPRGGSQGDASKAPSLDKTSGVSNGENVKSEMHNSSKQDDEYGHTVPTDGAPIMQGLMEDDTRDLPPIVMLDEFMESLDKEPPFESLLIDPGNETLVVEKESSISGSELKLAERASEDPDKMEVQKTEEVSPKSLKSDAEMKPTFSRTEPRHPVSVVTRADLVWDGLVQLNISFIASVVGTYKGGEKAIAKEWLNCFEVKGRVKLDAFEKFLQALRMSQSRAIMVAHFALKEGSTDSDLSNLQEMVDSYIVDSRVGFAEPAPGVELYLCPPHKGTLDMLRKHLPRNYTNNLDAIDNGFVGFIVWRKPPPIAPKPPGNHQLSSSRRPRERVLNTNVNFACKPDEHEQPHFTSKPVSDNDDDDDVPPGFGLPLAAARDDDDDDDLPEFTFSGGSHHHSRSHYPPIPGPGKVATPPRPVEQVRELIKKYGQSGNNNVSSSILSEPWWNDDDDDIPEWQPDAASQQRVPLPTIQAQQLLRQSLPQPAASIPHIANQAALQPPLNGDPNPMQAFQPYKQLLHQSMVPVPPPQNGSIGVWWTPGPSVMQQPNELGNQLPGQFLPGHPAFTNGAGRRS